MHFYLHIFFTLAFYFVFSLFLFGRLIYNACEIDDNICILYFTSSSKLTDAKIDFDHAFNNIKIDLNMFNYIKQQYQQETVFEKNQEYKYKYKIEFFLPKDNEKYQESIKLLKEKYFILQ